MTDRAAYAPGSLVHMSGSGYASDCDVVVKVTRPDGLVVTGDGSQTPGSDTVTTDLFGNFTYDYQLQSFPAIEGTYEVDALGYADSVLAHTTFEDAMTIAADVSPAYDPGNTTTTFSTLVRNTGNNGTFQHIRISLPSTYTNISVPSVAAANGTTQTNPSFSSGTWGAPVISQTNRTIDFSLTSGTGLGAGTGWARVDVTATTPATVTGNADEWNFDTWTTVSGTGKSDANDHPSVLVNGAGSSTTAALTWRDASGNLIAAPVLQNGVSTTLRLRVTQNGNGAKYVGVGLPTCFGTPTAISTSVSSGGNGSYIINPDASDTANFIRLPGGSIPSSGFLTVQFTTTPNCTSGVYGFPVAPATNQSNPASTDNQVVIVTSAQLSVAAGLADLSITKSDSPDPVAHEGTLTYSIGVHNGGPDDASAVKVVDTLPSGVSFVSATGTNWNCANTSGTVTCNRTGGNLAAGADAPNITIAVSAPAGTGTSSITNSATVSSPNDITPANNTATASTVVSTPPSLTTPTFSPASPKTNDLLQASTITSDADADQVSVAWTWKVTRGANTCTIATASSPLAAAGTRTASLDLSQSYATSSCSGGSPPSSINPSRGDVITAEATPTDAPGLIGTLKSNTVTVANSAPTATVSLNTHSPQTNDTLTATATKADVDGDPVTLTYVWKVNGVVKKTTSGSSSLTDTFDLSQPGNGDQGDTISVEVTPNDGTVSGSTASDSAAITNHAPTATVSLNDHSPKTNDTLTATATKADADGDPVTLTYVWKVNGVVKKTTSGSSALTDTFNLSVAGNGNRGDTVTVEVTPNDGSVNGSMVSDSATVANTAPTVTLSGANSLSVNEGSTQTYSYSISDPDGDTIASVSTSCGANATKVSGSDTFNNTSGSFQCGFGDGPITTTVSAQANDGTANSNSSTQSVSILNVAPTATLANNGPVNEGSSATISFSGQSDPSGADTSAGFRYEYRCDGSAFPGPADYSAASTSASTSCSFADNGSYTVRARIIDRDGGATAYTTTVVVQNVKPSLTAAGNQSSNEGSSHSFNIGSFSDPGADANWSVSVDWGDGSFATVFTMSSAGTIPAQSHIYADGPNDYTVSVTVSDKDGASDTRSFTAHVGNVAPSIAISGNASVNEGSAYSLNLGAVSDPGVDTVSGYVVHWGDGQSDTYGSNGAKSHTYADGPDDHAITVDLIDEDGTFTNAANALSVHVNNVAPSIAISGNSNVDEGSAYSLTLGAVSDPGADTVSSYVVHWGDGSSDIYSSSGTKSHTYADGPSDHAVTVDLADEDGTYLDRANAFSVHVNNVVPSISISGNSNVDEGSVYSLTLGAVSDPGTDAVSSYVVHWGDGSSDTYSSNGAKSHTYTDGPNDYAITVDLVDEDGTFTDRGNPLSVHVANVAPSINISGAANVNEGSAYSLTLGAVNDPGSDTVSSYVVHWGDGSSDTYSSNGAKSHTYADGPSDHNVTVDLVDEDGTYLDRANPLSVHVNNVAPSIAISGNANVNEGSVYSLTLGAVSDPGTDTVSSYVVHWGDGSSDAYSSNGAKSHTYTDGPNDYAITVDLVDEDGSYNDRANSLSVHVNNVAPSIAISGNASIDEGSAYSLTLGAASDPGADSVSSYVVHWGDGASDTYTSNGAKSHTYADGPNDYSVTVDLVDEDGTFLDRANSFSVHVDNVAPTAHVTGPANVDEGTTHTYSFTVSDPGDDTFSVDAGYPTCGTGGNYVSGSLSTDAHGGSFDCSFPDGPASTDVKIKVTDSDGASDTDSESVQVVQVANVAPSVTAPADQSSDEGSSHSFDLGSFTDPGDDSPWHVTVDWNDGSFATEFNVNSAGTIPAQSHTYADGPSDHTVTVTVDDGTDATSKTFSVHVNNVAPSIAISGNASVDEGSAYSLNLGAVSDPGADTVSSYVVHWGDGHTDTYSSNGAKSHTYADGPDDHNVTVDLVDEDGTFTNVANALSVHVNNVAPSISISGNTNVDEGSAYSLNVGAISDPGADTVSSYIVHWGDGHTDAYGSNGVKGHTYADGPNNYDITVDLVDEDGTFANAANPLSVQVNNVVPTITISGDASVNEGSAYSLNLGAVSDPGTDTVTSYVVHWGDGSENTYSSDGAKSHTYADGPSDHDIKVDLVDEDGTFLDRANPLSVHVNNVAPSIAISGAASVDEGSVYTLNLGTVSDPGTDTVSSYVVNWGDGSSDTYGTNGAKTHTYADGPNDYDVKVDLVDEDGSYPDRANPLSVHVNNVAPQANVTGPANVDEGSTHTYTFTVSDPGDDTFSVDAGYPTCGTGGNYVTGSLSTDAHGGSFDCSFPDGPASTDVKIKVTDSDGASDTDSESVQVVQVANVAPVVTAPADQASDEGESHSFDLGSFTDPGDDSPWHVTVDWGDGSTPTTFDAASTGSLGSKSHTYADGPNDRTVTVTVDDGTATDSKTFSVHVANVAPTVHLEAGNDLSVNEGSSHTYNYTISDPGQDTIASVATSCGGNGSKVPLSDANTDTGGSFGCTFPDGDAASTVSVQATDSDSDSGNIDTQSVTIHDVAPSIAISGNANVDEGSAYSLNLDAVSDPGADTVSSYVVNWGDGSSDTYSSNGAKSHSYADGPNDYAITVDLLNEDGTFNNAANSLSVHVNNVAPSVSFTSSPASANEGQTKTYTYTISDPGQDTVSAVHASCGSNGSISNASNTNTSGSFDCTFPDGPASSTVSISATDSDGDTGNTANQSVNVANVAPSIAISGNASVNEGSSYSLSLGAVSDPGADTVSSYVVHWGDGSSDTYASNGVKAHTYADGPNDYSVTVDLFDEDGTFADTANALSVHVNNVAPTANVTGPASVDEGTTHTYTFTVTDPGQDTFTVNEPAFPNCGTGGSYVAGSLTTNAGGGSFDCTFPDGPASTNVAIKVTDSDGASDTDSESVQVVNVANIAPNVTAPADQSSNEGSSHSFDLGSFTDPGDDSPWHVTVDWNDGSIATTFDVASAGTIPAQSHTYADGPSDHTVTVTVDDGADATSKTFAVHVSNVAPSIAISGNANVDEGSAYSLTLGTVSDPGMDTVSSYVVHWGDGSSDTYPSGGAKGHTYADGPNDYAITVDLVDEDGSHNDRANPLSVHVVNVAPTAHLSGDATADEGSTHTYSYTVTDPGQDTFTVNPSYPNCGSGGQLMLATVAQTATGGSFDCFFPNGPATTNVSIKVTDSDGASDTASESVQVVDVANVAPTVTAPANQFSDEGENHSFSLGSFTDPGADSPWHVTVAWGDGSGATTFDAASTGSLGSKPHTYADGPNDYTVTVSVNDGTDTRSATFSVHVNNVAPTVTLSGSQSVAEGSTATYSYTTSDPGAETFTRGAQDCGAGGTLSNASFTPATGAGSFDCKWDDGLASKSPSVTISDGDGGSDSKSLAVTVNNVAPTATFGNNGPVNEGQSFTLSLTSPQDPSSADTSAGFQYAFDCGDGAGYGSYGANSTATCPTTDSGTRAVKGKIKDKDGGFTEYTASVTVNNVAPSATFANDGLVNEGTSFHLSLTSPSDPSSGDTSAGFQYAFDCGSGTYTAYSPSNTATCSTNDNGVRTVRGKIKDKDGGERVYTGSVTVNNVAPVVMVTSPAYGALYAKNGTSNPTVTTTATFTDAGTADTHTCSVAWDDGTTSAGTVTEANGSGTCTASHVYTGAGVYTYHVTVTDDDGASTTVDWEVVVYDASAGFVTGGGWINVQPGSYPADPTLGGRANFGFNSKYTKNGGPPQGETEFQFQVGNFNFHSDVYTVLIVSSFKSQYRGSGSVNGVPGYDFSLTAYDGDVGGGGGVDKFRIRITLHSNGNVVFDNRITNGNTDMDTADPQAIAGGSIVIHKV